MRLTNLTAAIQEHAKVFQGDAEAIAKGLIERGLIQANVPIEPRPSERISYRAASQPILR